MGQSDGWLGVPIRERTPSEKVAYLDGFAAALNAVERLGMDWARRSLELARSTIEENDDV
jgi:hypothetical protein